MKSVENMTITKPRLKKALKNQIEPLIMPMVNKKIMKAVNDSKIQVGVMTKFYHYLDKCEIRLNNGNKVICKILHRFGMELMDFYTPEGEYDFCDKLKEPCIIPRANLNCLVLDVNDNKKERIMIGYFFDGDMDSWEPAEKGNFKVNTITGTNEYWIKFGVNGLDVRCPKKPTTTAGLMDDEMNEVSYANPDDYYTKEEIDKMLEELRKEGGNHDDNS